MSLYNPDSYVGDFILRVFDLTQPATAWRGPRTTVFPRVNWYPKSLYPHGNPGINQWGHKTCPSLSRPVYGILMAEAAPAWPVIVPIILGTAATDVFPTVAGPQYQSAMSGQVGIGSSALQMDPVEHWTDFFTWSYWRGY
jgi:hypothetical protein